MKNTLLLRNATIFLLAFNFCFSQSKRKKIEILNHRVDSLQQVLLESKIKLDSLDRVNKLNLKSIGLLKQDLSNKNQDLINLKKDNDNFKIQILNTHEEYRIKINGLKDSLDSIPKVTVNTFDAKDFIKENFYFEFIWDENFDKDNLNGTFISYYPDGWNGNDKARHVFAKGRYMNGFKEGFWEYNTCDGSKKCEGKYSRGLMDGVWMNYDLCSRQLGSDLYTLYSELSYNDIIDELNINFIEKIIYSNGKIGDTNYVYNEKNELRFKIVTSNFDIFYSNGQPLSKKSVQEGWSKVFFRNGQERLFITDEITSNKTEKNGIHSKYYRNGQLESNGKYENNIGVGYWIYYDVYGNITHQGEWLGEPIFCLGGLCECPY